MGRALLKPRQPVRVVVADDADSVRELLVLLLELEDDFVVVGQAANGLEALDRAREMQPDLIVLDVSMPRMDGISALPLLRQVSPSSRVALFSGMVEPAVEREARAAGADLVLSKDAGVNTVIERLRDLCQRGPASLSALG